MDLVFPRNCVITGEPVEDGCPFQFISQPVMAKLFRVEPPHCRTCGYPYFGAVLSNDRTCPKCRELKPRYREGRTVILVEGVGRELVHQFKYEGATYLLQDFFQLFQACGWLAGYLADAHLVPVPLHPRKLRERGFNQSEGLCRILHKLQPSSNLADILNRTVDTPSQTLFSRRERMRNLRNVFQLKPSAQVVLGNRYLIVDDVFTTGSTLNACAWALQNAGIDCIDILTLGHG